MGLKKVLRIILEIKKASWQITRQQREDLEDELEKYGYEKIEDRKV